MKFMLWHVVTAGMAGLTLGVYIGCWIRNWEVKFWADECNRLYRANVRLMDRKPI